ASLVTKLAHVDLEHADRSAPQSQAVFLERLCEILRHTLQSPIPIFHPTERALCPLSRARCGVAHSRTAVLSTIVISLQVHPPHGGLVDYGRRITECIHD